MKLLGKVSEAASYLKRSFFPPENKINTLEKGESKQIV